MAAVHSHGCPGGGLDDIQWFAVDRDEHIHVDLAIIQVHEPLRGVGGDPHAGVELRVEQLGLGSLESVAGLAAIAREHRPQGHGSLENENQLACHDDEPRNEITPESGGEDESRIGEHTNRGEQGHQEQGRGVATRGRGSTLLRSEVVDKC